MRIYGDEEPEGPAVPNLPAPDSYGGSQGSVSMNHGKHSYLMIGLVAAGAVLFLTGNAGGLLFLLWPLACLAMMVWMMWGMVGMGRSAPGPADHTHDDGLTQAHR